jgi:hypothetical protein
MKFKILIVKYLFFIPSFSFKLKYLNQKNFLSHIEKTQLSSHEHKIYILMGFQFYIGKIKISSSIHIVNFDMG